MKDKIVITKWLLSDKYSLDENVFNPNRLLEEAINEYAERELTPNNIEIFKRDRNILITEQGCYGAFFEKDLEKLNE